jgi:subtilisin family serine protease
MGSSGESILYGVFSPESADQAFSAYLQDRRILENSDGTQIDGSNVEVLVELRPVPDIHQLAHRKNTDDLWDIPGGILEPREYWHENIRGIQELLRAELVSVLEHFIWLRVPTRLLEDIRNHERERITGQTDFDAPFDLLETLAQLGVDGLWPNPPLIPQSFIGSVDTPKSLLSALSAIGAAPTPNDGKGVTWAIVDTDVRASHDFFCNATMYRWVVSPKGVQPAGAYDSCSPHGTHVAGIVHAVAPGAALVSVALHCSSIPGRTPPVAVKDMGHLEVALQWISRQPGIAGVNISLGVEPDYNNAFTSRGPGTTGLEACTAAGKMVVVSAGNYGSRAGAYHEISITDPANARSALVVGACHTDDPLTEGIWSKSSHGPTADGRIKPDLVAPGVGIESAGALNDQERVLMSGTSQAAAIVSGTCAVLMSRASIRRLPEDWARHLCQTTKDLKRDETYQGAGLVRLDQAVARLAGGPQVRQLPLAWP